MRGALENRFASVWVEGEISNFKQAASGHWYFTVKDEGAQLRATCFRGVNRRIRFRPSDGLLVRARGRLTVYEPRGEYELMVEALDPVGAGALRVAFEQLKERLAAEGLFDESSEARAAAAAAPRRRRHLARRARPCATSSARSSGARAPSASCSSPDARAGRGRGAEIARAIAAAERAPPARARRGTDGRAVDAIIVGRGGGSAEDLWAFNEEEVARAIRASLVPVISAVGHETDFTIADFAADVRAATPTAAAEIVAEREDEIAAYVERLTHDLVNAARYRLHRAARARAGGGDVARLRRGADAPARRRARRPATRARRLERSSARFDWRARAAGSTRAACRLSPARHGSRAPRARACVWRWTARRLEAAARARLEDARSRLAVAAASLDAMSPLAVLGRGYALAEDERGRLLRSARGVAGGRARARASGRRARCAAAWKRSRGRLMYESAAEASRGEARAAS